MSKVDLFYDDIETQVGIISAILFQDKLIRVDFHPYEEDNERTLRWLNQYFPERSMIKDTEKLAPFLQQIEEYFANKRTTFDLPYESYGTDFQKKVWRALTEIKYGQMVTYKQLAKRINNEKAARAVGGALNKNPISIIVPCHRVVGSTGKMVGFGGGVDVKKQLLLHEKAVLV